MKSIVAVAGNQLGGPDKASENEDEDKSRRAHEFLGKFDLNGDTIHKRRKKAFARPVRNQ